MILHSSQRHWLSGRIPDSLTTTTEFHRQVSRSVRNRPGRGEKDPGGRRLFALQEAREAAEGQHRDRQEQRAAHRPLGTGKTLLCETLAKILGVPFVTADATSLAQTRFVNEEIEAILQRLVDKADGSIARRSSASSSSTKSTSSKPAGDSAHLGRKRAARAAENHGRLAGQAREQGLRRHDQHPVHLRRRIHRARGHHVQIARLRLHLDDQGRQPEHLDRPQFARETTISSISFDSGIHGPPAHHRRFQTLTRTMLVRIMTEPKNSHLQPVPRIFKNEGVELAIEPRVSEQISEIAMEYKTGARSLRGIFEETDRSAALHGAGRSHDPENRDWGLSVQRRRDHAQAGGLNANCDRRSSSFHILGAAVLPYVRVQDVARIEHRIDILSGRLCPDLAASAIAFASRVQWRRPSPCFGLERFARLRSTWLRRLRRQPIRDRFSAAPCPRRTPHRKPV